MFRVEVVVTPAWPADLLSIETLPKQWSLESGWERPLKECWCRRLPRWPPHSCRSEVSLPTSLWIPQEANEFSRQNLFLKPVSSEGLKFLVYQTLVILLLRTVYFITLSFIGLWLFGNLLNSLCILRLNTLLAKVVLPPCRPSPHSISGFLYCSEFFYFMQSHVNSWFYFLSYFRPFQKVFVDTYNRSPLSEEWNWISVSHDASTQFKIDDTPLNLNLNFLS